MSQGFSLISSVVLSFQFKKHFVLSFWGDGLFPISFPLEFNPCPYRLILHCASSLCPSSSAVIDLFHLCLFTFPSSCTILCFLLCSVSLCHLMPLSQHSLCFFWLGRGLDFLWLDWFFLSALLFLCSIKHCSKDAFGSKPLFSSVSGRNTW